MTESVKIKALSRWRLRWAGWGGKRRNKRLLNEISQWNRDLLPPAVLNSALNLDRGDFAFLKGLAWLKGGWQPLEFVKNGPSLGDPLRLADLGLILISWNPARLMLSDAGRFLLSLNAVDPALISPIGADLGRSGGDDPVA